MRSMVGDSGRPYTPRAIALTGPGLRAWREARGWSLGDFSRRTRLPEARLEGLEQGREPMLRDLELLVERMPASQGEDTEQKWRR